MNSDQIYDEYWNRRNPGTTAWSQEEFSRWLGPIAGKHSVLDYGCGMGYTYQSLLRQNCSHYCGADVGHLVLEDLSRKELPGLKISPSGTVESQDASFDAAVCSEVMEHLWDPLAAAKELHRILKPEGVLVATVPNFGYLPWRLLALLRARVWSEPDDGANDPFKGVHIRYFSMQMFERLFRYAGFRSVQITHFDRCNIFDVFYAFGPLAKVGNQLTSTLPSFCRLQLLERIWPNVFAQRLRAVCVK